MSKYKKIRELLSFYIITAYQDMENKDLFEEEGDSNKEDDDDLVMLGLTSLLRIKYLEQRSYHVAKSKDWYNYILPKYEDCRFKKIIRMNSINFQKLVSLLITHPIFQNNRNHLQASVELQLAIFLRRIGSKEDIFGLCSRFGITKETIYLYCKRQPETYWNRKKKYSIQLQGIVDYRGMFIDYEIGWPGLIHDTKVYKNSYFYRNVSKIIKEEEYLLGNSAYPIFIFLIKPFVNSQNPSQIQFNVIHSLHRVVAENAFGRLKNRFITLKELNIRDTIQDAHLKGLGGLPKYGKTKFRSAVRVGFRVPKNGKIPKIRSGGVGFRPSGKEEPRFVSLRCLGCLLKNGKNQRFVRMDC
ncbi:putative nuclease HARBI1 [Rhizophagus irregularis DAOM 181602=DAOM 197198]|nr:putative nuclease HARBI1 [Rhizophagus irregularis DAOM 181602=DAOM 197198]